MLERWNPTVKAFTVLVCVILLKYGSVGQNKVSLFIFHINHPL